ncbi:conserved hypothetical protein [[Clostridium] ultunense Esp]|uniref:hypothetical protein n=1 Tax=Thermicanus aegyptius TaxID=94009 RepID=UPI0002B6F423|nr:hypothetical protein [Thermicanus aegyptius]CCQ93324.1 conserved hypothetical protein [[Clostridium] ultunense Esp]
MEIFFTPEFLSQDSQILNVVDEKNQPVGYLSILQAEKNKIYLYGHLENEGVRESFKSMVNAYLQGLAKEEEREIYSYVSIGGEKMEIKEIH